MADEKDAPVILPENPDAENHTEENESYEHIPLLPHKTGDKFTDLYCVVNAFRRTASNGNTFYDVTLADRSGQIVAKLFGDTTEHADDIVQLTGIHMFSLSVDSYQGVHTYKIVAFEAVPEIEDWVIAHIVPEVANLPVIKKCLQMELDAIENPFLSGMVKNLFASPEIFNSAAGTEGPFAIRGGLAKYALDLCDASTDMVTSELDLEQHKSSLDIVRAASFLACYGWHKCAPIANYFPKESVSNILTGPQNCAMMDMMNYWHKNPVEDKAEANKSRMLMAKVLHILSACSGSVQPATIEAIIVKSMMKLIYEIEEAKLFIAKDVNDGLVSAFDPLLKRKYFKGK